jgi:hypothetical protein
MPVDPDYIRQHYRSLSDEALLKIDRAELVEAARNCYDDELTQRKLEKRRVLEADKPEPAPEWLHDAAEVYSCLVVAGTTPAQEMANARGVLEAAGIPCHVQVKEPEEEPESNFFKQAPEELVLMVPGRLNQQAASILDRDIFNEDFEAEWKTHLEQFTDEEVREMNPREAFCGLFDRVERVTRAYQEELARRGLK